MTNDTIANLILGTLGLLIVAAAFVCSSGPNYMGWHRDAARKNARTWANSVGLHTEHITCVEQDTDGDGYVSCTFSVGGQPRTYECAGWTLVMPHSGCREPKLRIGGRNE